MRGAQAAVRPPARVRILLHTLVFAPDGVSTAQLMSELAVELRDLGHEVVVLTTVPHYNADAEARALQPLRRYRGRWLYRSDYQGIPVFHVAMPAKGSRVVARLLDYARFHLLSLLAGRALVGRYDIVFAPSPPLTIGLSAWSLALLRRVPFIYNVQEIFPEIAVSLGILRNRPLIRVLEGVERFIYARARAVTVISERFRLRLIDKGVPAGKLRAIPNFVDTDFIAPLPRRNGFSAAHGLDDAFVVLYAGNIGLTQGFETILAAARQLVDLADLRFLVVGDGARRAWLAEQIALGVPNVTLLPYQPRSVVPEIYASGDLCLVPLKRGTAQDTFPSKIYTILSAGRPVLAAADPDSELAWLVAEADCGQAVPPDDADALAAAIRRAYCDRTAAAAQGVRGRDYVLAHHSRRAVARRYDDLIRELVPGGRWRR